MAHHLTRHGRGWFEQGLGPGVKIEWFVYNAGPSAMEAILANSIDVTYVGPKTRPCSRPGSASCTGAGVRGEDGVARPSRLPMTGLRQTL